MSQIPKPSGSSRGSSLAAKLALAAVFLVVLIAAPIWIVRTFMMQPTTVAVPLPEEPGRVVPLRPTVHNGPAASSGPTFTGTVVDAQTHQPVVGVVALVGYGPNTFRPANYFTNAGRSLGPGQYTVSARVNFASNTHWFVRVYAHGYLPAVSAAQPGSATVNFELTPAKDIVGHVYGIDGKPAAFVSIVTAIPGLHLISLRDGVMSALSAASATSGPDGAYDLPPQTGEYLIVACGSGGIAQANQDDIAKSADIHLLAWGRVEGRVMVGSHPAAGSDVVAVSTDFNFPVNDFDLWPPIESFNNTVNADNDGHFVLAKVLPGPLHIRRRFAHVVSTQNPEIRNIGNTQSVWTTVQPGKTVTANLGGGGRQVAVNVIFPDSLNTGRHDLASRVTNLPAAPVVPEMPDDVKNSAAEARQTWMQNFLTTPAGRAYLPFQGPDAPSQPDYALEYSDGNTFHIEDVQPGDYQIRLSVQLNGGGQLPTIRPAHAYFTMPPITPDVADKPLVIPDITLTTN